MLNKEKTCVHSTQLNSLRSTPNLIPLNCTPSLLFHRTGVILRRWRPSSSACCDPRMQPFSRCKRWEGETTVQSAFSSPSSSFKCTQIQPHTITRLRTALPISITIWQLGLKTIPAQHLQLLNRIMRSLRLGLCQSHCLQVIKSKNGSSKQKLHRTALYLLLAPSSLPTPCLACHASQLQPLTRPSACITNCRAVGVIEPGVWKLSLVWHMMTLPHILSSIALIHNHLLSSQQGGHPRPLFTEHAQTLFKPFAAQLDSLGIFLQSVFDHQSRTDV